MKRPLQLPLAIALALGGTNAMALGLGPVQVKSKLNQPLDAEIPVIQGTAGEAEGLLVSLAAAEDFDRIGISRSRLNVPLEFKVVQGANGPVIKVTSKDPVRDAYLDFLVEANWPKGRLLREYTVLLDPPVTAPGRRAASAPAATAAPRVSTEPLREARPAPAPKATVAQAPARPAAKPKPAPATPAAPAPTRIADGEYGPVEAGETLSAIARAARPDAGVNVNQMMLALLKANPDAFYKDNVNALKRGAILRIPSESEIAATGSAREVAAEIQSQIEDWRGGRASPTRIADAGTQNVAPTPVAKTDAGSRASSRSVDDERLELVPPKAGNGNLAMADQPGSGPSGAAVSNALKAELARAKEALATREQESGELKSRLRELEDIGNKNDRLISLKDSEIADLQRKLRELQEQEKTVAATPTATPAPTPAPAAVTPPVATPAPPAAAPLAVTTEPTTPTTTVTATPSPDQQAQLDKKDIWGDSAPDAKADSGKSADAAVQTTDAADADAAPTAPAAAATTAVTDGDTVTSPVAAEQAAAPSGGAVVTPLAPTTPAAPPVSKPVAKAPAVIVAPWYDAPWVKPAAIGAGVLLLVGGLVGMRRRKPVPASARGSIADSFGASPLGAGSAAVAAEAEHLREQLRDDPTNLGLYLELLSVHYAERDVEGFEEVAAAMHAQVYDPNAPEWLEAQAMGQELAPHNPLFADESGFPPEHAVTEELPENDAYAPSSRYDTRAPAEEDEYAFGDLEQARDDVFDVQPPASHDAAAGADPFTFEDLPPLEVPMDEKIEATPAVPDVVPVDDGFFSGDDAIGTKLDLAKAYMDMGDPDGARSMLEEVVAEGNDAQRAEAHRLMADLR